MRAQLAFSESSAEATLSKSTTSSNHRGKKNKLKAVTAALRGKLPWNGLEGQSEE
jgi:hypothetical protein